MRFVGNQKRRQSTVIRQGSILKLGTSRFNVYDDGSVEIQFIASQVLLQLDRGDKEVSVPSAFHLSNF